jgi:hypothetical protein
VRSISPEVAACKLKITRPIIPRGSLPAFISLLLLLLLLFISIIIINMIALRTYEKILGTRAAASTAIIIIVQTLVSPPPGKT